MNNIQVRPPYSNELYHHGVKGQKWGVRKYQNPDGSLTPEGKKRYNKSYAKKIDDAIERRYKEGGMTERNAALSAINDMSVSNAIKMFSGYALGGIGGAALSSGAAAAGTALGSAGLLTVSTAAPIVGAGVAIGSIAKGLYNAVQLQKAENYYKYKEANGVKTVNVT